MVRAVLALVTAAVGCTRPQPPTLVERIDVSLQRAGSFLVARETKARPKI